MSTTEDRIVRMQFDNASFKKGAADTQKSLADLNKSVDSAGKARGLTDMSGAMDDVAIHASKMSILTTAALATIGAKITSTALDLAKGLTLDPLKAGFAEYEEGLTKLNTIMNATGFSQKRVQGVLTDLNKYSDKTIYSFSNMTSAITKFVNAGVPLDQAALSVKGIANAAAYAGASSEEADRAMYAFSQSMSMGFIMLQDWNQIENANMGTQSFKQTLLDTAVATGDLTKRGDMYITKAGNAISATKGWRDGLQDQWATTEVLNKSLAKYTDTSTKLGREATQSATEVRTFTAFMDTLKESLGSGWASIFKALIGNLDQATSFWTGLAGAIGGGVKAFFHFGSSALMTWRNLGGFEKTMQGFKNLLSPIGALLGAIGKAWNTAFPSSSSGAGKALYGLSAGFEAITRPLQWLATGITHLTPLLTTFFRILHIGGSAIGDVIGVVAHFVTSLLGLSDIKAPSAGGFFDFIKGIGKAISDTVKKIDDLIRKGASIGQAFGSAFGSVKMALPDMPKMPSMPALSMPDMSGSAGGISMVSGLVKKLTGDFGGLKGASDKVSGSGMFDPVMIKSVGATFTEMGGNAKDMVTKVAGSGDEIKSAWDGVVEFFGNIGSAIGEALSNISLDDIVSSFNFAVFTAMGIQVAKFIHTLNSAWSGFDNIMSGVGDVLDGAGQGLKSFQTQAKAEMIKQIAIAIAVLAGSLLVLSLIPAKKLVTALAGLTGAMLIMVGAMKLISGIVDKMDGKGTTVKLLALSVALAALGFAMLEMSIALKIMDSVDIDGIVKGLVVMFATMQVVGQLGKLGASAAKGMLGGAAAIAIIAASMILLAGALLLFKLVDWESMGKAGVALAGLTLAVAALALIPYAGIAKVGLALMGAAAGLLLMANALIIFGLVEWESIGKAAVVLLALTVALGALMLVGGGGLAAAMFVGIGAAMLYLSFALKNLNEVEWSSIGKLAVVMLILVVAITALTVALSFLAPVAPLLLVLALAILALGVAMAAFAAGMALVIAIAGAGTAAFVAMATGAAVGIAVFMQTLAHEAPVMKKAFLNILEQLIDTIVKAVPMIVSGLKRLWNAVVKELSSPDKGGQAAKAGEGWMEKIKGAIAKYLPIIVQKAKDLAIGLINGLQSKAGEIASAGVRLIVSLLNGISREAGKLVAAGVRLIVSLINGIAREAPKITAAAVDLIIKLANGIEDGLADIVNAGVNLIAEFLHDLADAIRNGSAAIGSGISDVASAFGEVGTQMVQGLIDGVTGMMDDALGAIGNLAGGMVDKAKGILDIFSPSKVFYNIGKFLVQGLTHGIQNNAASAIRATAHMVNGQIALSEELVNGMIQRLDQRAIAARGRAQGLAAAAKKAQKAAEDTKTKVDDKSARVMGKQAKNADQAADKAESKAKSAKSAQARQEKWRNADALERAKIRAADAQRQISSAKQAEQDAQAARAQADALDRRAKAKGVTKEQAKTMREQADRLRKDAREDAARANKQLKNARSSARSAMEYQRKAGKEASHSFSEQYREQAKADKEAAAFEKLSDEKKAAQRREEAAALQKKADANLALAKKQAFKDVQKANATAKLAMDQAEKARAMIKEAKDLEANLKANAEPPTQILNLKPTEAAALAVNAYSDLYDSAYAAAASDKTVEFNQYNSSPESLSASEIYRQTNNIITYASDKLQPSAA